MINIPEFSDASLMPPVRTYALAASVANGWSDQYGGLHLLAEHAGVLLPHYYQLNAVWHHGCNPPWYNYSAEVVVGSTPNARQMPVLVGRREQESLLRQHGFNQARAIGIPMVYTRENPVARLPRSLLVMPTHTLAGEVVGDRSDFEKYADEILAITGDFNRVTVCIHPGCLRNGLWIREFSARGFEVVYGAQNNDRNALARMRWLFERYETVTTNGWGSHIAYALAFGARVAVHGTKPKREESNYLRDTSWVVDPQALKVFLSEEIAAQERAFLKDFYRPSQDSRGDVELGRWLIGAEHRVAPAEAKEILAGILKRRVPSVPEARAARQGARREARQLVDGGAKAGAVKLLLHAVREDMATRLPGVLFESLWEIGHDLAPLEPAQSRQLVAEAEKMAHAHGISLTELRARFGGAAGGSGQAA